MDLIKVYNTNNIPEIAVLKSRLEAAGLHPFVQNYEHAQMAHFDILALGGMNVLMPENEVEAALELIHDNSGEFIDTDMFDDYNPPWAQKEPYKAKLWPIISLLVFALLIVILTSADAMVFLIIPIALLLFHAQRSATKIQNEKDKHS